MKNWQNVEFSYYQEQEDGSLKTRKNVHLIEAENFIDAETRAYELFASEFSEMKVEKIKKARISDVIGEGSSLFLAKVVYITTNDRGKEKRKNESLLIRAPKFDLALAQFNSFSSTWSIPFELIGIQKTNLVEVWEIDDQDEDQNEDGDSND